MCATIKPGCQKQFSFYAYWHWTSTFTFASISSAFSLASCSMKAIMCLICNKREKRYFLLERILMRCISLRKAQMAPEWTLLIETTTSTCHAVYRLVCTITFKFKMLFGTASQLQWLKDIESNCIKFCLFILHRSVTRFKFWFKSGTNCKESLPNQTTTSNSTATSKCRWSGWHTQEYHKPLLFSCT